MANGDARIESYDKPQNNCDQSNTRNDTGLSRRISRSSSKDDLWQKFHRESEQSQEHYRETLEQKRLQTDNNISNTSLEDVQNNNRAESMRDASTVISTELVASKHTQSSGLRHSLKAALFATLLATANAREVHANHTAVVEWRGPAVYGLSGQHYSWPNNPENCSSIGDDHGHMLNPRGDLEQPLIRRRDTAKRSDSPQAEQGTAKRRIRLFKITGPKIGFRGPKITFRGFGIRYTGPRINYRPPKLSLKWG